jgi:putative nucleotidyltransferase with HDIG domain
MNSLSMEKPSPNVRRLKRVAQKAVYLILEDESFLLGLASIKNYDEYTFNHSVNVAIYALAIGTRLGFSKNTLRELGMTALLHDIGKSKIPKEILNKPGSLSEDEWQIIKSHPLQGVEIVLNLKQMGEIDPKMVFGIFEHHQKDNLLGYPELILKEERDFFGQIIQIADVYDALATPRVYKKAFTPEQALGMMVKDKGSNFDLILLKVFISLLGIYPVGSLVLLNTQEMGVVYQSNPRFADRPQVILLARDEAGYPKKEMMDLTETDERGQYKRSIIRTLDPLRYHLDIGKYFI